MPGSELQPPGVADEGSMGNYHCMTVTRNDACLHCDRLLKCTREPTTTYFFFSVRNDLCTKVSTCVMAKAVPRCFSCKTFGCHARHGGDAPGVGACLAYTPERFPRDQRERGMREATDNQSPFPAHVESVLKMDFQKEKKNTIG